METCNQISIDVNGLYKAIQDECFILLNDVAAKVVEGFQLFIVSDGAGRTKWRENAAKEFKILSDKITDDVVELQVGVRDNLESEAWNSFYAAQIMVALYGNHGPLYTKPGEMTFHDHMESIDVSGAQSVWALPQEFNWDDPHPEKMLSNVMKVTTHYFQDGMKTLINKINFYDYVYVTPR